MSETTIRQSAYLNETISKLYVVINGLASRIKKLEEENTEMKIKIQNRNQWLDV